ncbi:hypothetical protein F1559_003294 [Cyanidiococcus yangmingshanensis]|uniref:Uncharacterized protein n=1 Tax=Cyanidiococcus yangmingshanensis TaxID=2690220 RepID=A0A7J7IGX8_9RHOD|nr:hypothetical protein F1559_003294 [Cyanidiococcus yangmingshanensis]
MDLRWLPLSIHIKGLLIQVPRAQVHQSCVPIRARRENNPVDAPLTASPSGYEAEASQTRSLHPPDLQQLAELYERAQYYASIGPRLYVLASLAAALMESDIQRQDEIVQDLMEMLHGIQQPLLSLYLRAFVAKVVLCAWQNTADAVVVASEALVRCLVENWIEMVESWLRLSRYGLDFGVALSMETLSRLRIWRQVLAQELRTLVGAQLGALAWMPKP